jgi:hypothetical protein
MKSSPKLHSLTIGPKRSTDGTWKNQNSSNGYRTHRSHHYRDQERNESQKSYSLRRKESAKTKKPPGNWAASSFQGRIVPTEAKPSKLSEEIL